MILFVEILENIFWSVVIKICVDVFVETPLCIKKGFVLVVLRAIKVVAVGVNVFDDDEVVKRFDALSSLVRGEKIALIEEASEII